MRSWILCIAATMVWFAVPVLGETPLGTAFAYQGQLKQDGVPLTGTADFQFALWDASGAGNPPVGGTQIGGVEAMNNQPVTAGLFTVNLNGSGAFGVNAFDGNARWLQIAVRSPAGVGDFTTLAPRQALTATPYALHSAGPWVTTGQDVSYVRGAVGVGTSTPEYPLDVAGDTKLRERLAVGNDASFEPNQRFPHSYADFDFSHVHSDFTTSEAWSAFRSFITFDPSIDLPPSANFSHELECFTPANNSHNYSQLQGPYMAAFHEGSGHVDMLAGGSFVAQTYGGGSVNLQIGGYVGSILGTGNSGSGNIQNNEGLEVITGNAASPGSILTNDYSIYVYSPYNDQPMTNHYGLYLEDQDFGVDDSYAIYSAGGQNYLAGNLGIGTSAPQAKLHIGGVAGVDGIMFPDGSLQTTAAGLGLGGGGFWSASGANIYKNTGGNVGIGTSTPTQLLTLQTPTNSYGLLHTDGVRSLATFLGGGGNGGYLGTTSNHPLHLYANDSDPLLTVHPNRNVGIGTITPASKLDIVASGDGAELLRFSTERPWLFRQVRTGPSAGLQLLSTVGQKKFEITANDGNNVATFLADSSNSRVGIGTTDPAAKLHVVGGDLVTGSTTGANIVMRDAEIQARFNGGPFGLVINNNGGDVVFGGAIDIGYEIVTADNSTDALCPPGKKVLGGGCAVFGGNQDVKHSYPANNGWHCDAGIDHDVGTTFYNLTSYAICARVK